MLMGADLPISSIHRQTVAAIDLVIQIDRLTDGRRVVSQVSELTGIHPVNGDVMVTDIFNRRSGELAPTGYLPTFVDSLIQKNLLEMHFLYGDQQGKSNGTGQV